MPNVVNPIDLYSVINLTDAINSVDPQYGWLMNSNLFDVKGQTTDTLLYEINGVRKQTMIGLTSRTEREKVMGARRRKKSAGLVVPYMSTIDQVTSDDVRNISKTWDMVSQEDMMTIFTEKLTEQRANIELSHEYMILSAAQGITRDPLDGSEVVNMFDVHGVTQQVVTWDFTDVNFSPIRAINELRNKLVRDNTLSSTVGLIEVLVGVDLFDAIVTHAEMAERYVSAFAGVGVQALLASTPYDFDTRTAYGITNMFEWNGIRFMTYPTNFRLEDGSLADPLIADDEGFCMCRGVRNLYRGAYAPDTRLVNVNTVGQAMTAYRTAIIDESYFNIVAESSALYYMTAPELALKIEAVLV